MTPYWTDGERTIYNADCREVLPFLPDVDIVLTDPPWVTSSERVEINHPGVAKVYQSSKTVQYGDVGHFNPDVIRHCQYLARNDCFYFCGYKELATVIGVCGEHLRGVFVWHKPNAMPAARYPARPDCSFIAWAARKSLLYGKHHWPSMIFSVPFPAAGCMKTERFVTAEGKAVHPCQGPVVLYARLLGPFEAGCVVLDPYMGTGTTLRAAKDAGLKAIGIEIEERYCELAAKRLSQAVLPFPLE